jgi:3-hydroxyisobutyrate dehydrogenase-like beta-hydroxyacid dehydrogenase
MRPGTAIALHATIGPGEARALAEAARSSRLELIDAPVSGGADRAAVGDLVTMVGADTGSWVRFLPVFETFSSLVLHVGAVGTGQLAKLLNNAMLAAHLGIADDALELADRLGLDRSSLAQVLQRGSGRSRGAALLVEAEGMLGIARSPAHRALGKDVRLLLELHDESAAGPEIDPADRPALLLPTARGALGRIEAHRPEPDGGVHGSR